MEHNSHGKEDACIPQSLLTQLMSESIRQSPVSVLITDKTGAICYANDAFLDQTGYELDELCGKNPRILQSGLTPLKTYEKLWKTILAGQVWCGDLCNKTKAGKTYWESVRIFPLLDQHDEVTHFVAFWEDVTDDKFEDQVTRSHIRTLEHDSITDFLTGLYNRRHILEELEKEENRALRYGRQFSGMLLDVDEFKSVNDTYGHLTGDYVLSEVAKMIQDTLRKVDVLGRYGSDEFLIILPEADLEGARIVAERVMKNIAEHTFKSHGKQWHLSVSIGLSFFEDGKGAEIDSVVFLDKLDQALLQAKKQGKNQIVLG